MKFAMRRASLGVALLGSALLLPAGAEAQRRDRDRDRENDLTVHLRDAEGRLTELRDALALTLSRAQLGVTIDDDDDGARVATVLEDGPAAEAGLQEGDVIVALDGVGLTSRLDDEDEDDDWSPTRRLVHLMRDVDPGDEVRVDYLRNGRRASLDVTARRRTGLSFFGDAAPLQAYRFEGDEGPLHAYRFSGNPGRALQFAIFGGAFRGAKLADVNAGLGSYFGVDAGALVLDVDDDENDLGLRPGDVIVEIGGRDVEDASDAYRILGSYEQGERLRVVVVRERSRVTLEATAD
jgi:serine protease Do